MQNTVDQTRTGLRNIPSTPSLLDQARKQARLHDCAVMYRGPFSWRVALPTDTATGAMNLQYTGSFDGMMDDLTADGWRVEVII